MTAEQHPKPGDLMIYDARIADYVNIIVIIGEAPQLKTRSGSIKMMHVLDLEVDNPDSMLRCSTLSFDRIVSCYVRIAAGAC